ncbi:unnamed protein product [Lactuca virosa]|uniref:Protein RER1 n=1 Tax=Lactuca virosa TaxID=75947 RepID=A0AAU9M9S3_9ASTR|nr:unnamed protein product [Lactuca virosa]
MKYPYHIDLSFGSGCCNNRNIQYQITWSNSKIPITPSKLGAIPFGFTILDNYRIRIRPLLSLDNICKGKDQSLFSMEGLGADSTSPMAPVAKWKSEFSRVFQFYLDKSTPLPVHRWLGTLGVASIYVLRVYYLEGFYIISYGLGIYILNLLIGFLSPKVDPELEVLDGASLPTKESDEFRPFIRRLPEFKFWYAITKAFMVAFLMTFFSLFDVPVFWPILLCYWIVLFALTMKRQIMHMIKYKYVPFTTGKQKYGGRKSPGGSAGGSPIHRALTIITPILVRLSASAKPLNYNGEIKNNGSQSRKVISLLSRKALGSITHSQSVSISIPTPAPAPISISVSVPTPTPTRKVMPILEHETSLVNSHILAAKTSIQDLATFFHAKKQSIIM